uniref:Transmembrane protein n=1 Tax=Globodera pallida TaxID=36090 RepID=A0A183C657_GLOPA
MKEVNFKTVQAFPLFDHFGVSSTFSHSSYVLCLARSLTGHRAMIRTVRPGIAHWEATDVAVAAVGEAVAAEEGAAGDPVVAAAAEVRDVRWVD